MDTAVIIDVKVFFFKGLAFSGPHNGPVEWREGRGWWGRCIFHLLR